MGGDALDLASDGGADNDLDVRVRGKEKSYAWEYKLQIVSVVVHGIPQVPLNRTVRNEQSSMHILLFENLELIGAERMKKKTLDLLSFPEEVVFGREWGNDC